MRYALVKEAGFKCANPGCTNYRTHIHHIRQWAIYQTHDEKYMIAICPSCHDAVKHGSLTIDDKTLIRWKKILRKPVKEDQIFIESAIPPKLIFGSISATGKKGAIVFKLSPNNQLSFRIEDEDIFLINLMVSTINGKVIFKVIDNHIKYDEKGSWKYSRRPGKFRMIAPPTQDFIQPWALEKMRKHEPDYATNEELVLLDLEVLEPGLVKVQGVWNEKNRVIIITQDQISFVSPHREEPLSIRGAGADTVLNWEGPITDAMFGF